MKFSEYMETLSKENKENKDITIDESNTELSIIAKNIEDKTGKRVIIQKDSVIIEDEPGIGTIFTGDIRGQIKNLKKFLSDYK